MNLNDQYQGMIENLARDIRTELQECESLNRFDFRVKFESRVHDGDMELMYQIGEYGSEVTGPNMDTVLAEFLHQHGWRKNNNPLCLPNVKLISDETDD